MPHMTHVLGTFPPSQRSPLLAAPDPLCLSKEIVQLQRQVIGLETERKQLLTENALLRLRLRLYSSSIESFHSVLKDKSELGQFSVCLPDSQSGSKAATLIPPLAAPEERIGRFDLSRTQQAPFEKLALQCDLALSDVDMLAQSFTELERTSQYQQFTHSVLNDKIGLKQPSVCLPDSQSGSKAATSIPPLAALDEHIGRFDLSRTQRAPFEKLALQCDLALSDVDMLAQSLIELERTSQYQQSISQQLLIELLFMRKQVRTLHVENQAKSNLLRLVSTTHSRTKKLMKASHDEVTRQLLIQLLVFRKDLIHRRLLMPSSDTSAITDAPSSLSNYEITELGILRLSEAELRAEKESLIISLKELLDIVFRDHFTSFRGQEEEDPPITELVFALVYAWKSSRQRSITRPQIKAVTTNFVHAAEATFSRSCVRYKPPHRRDVESKTRRPLQQPLANQCKQPKKNSNIASAGSILRVGASSLAHVKFVPVRPRKAVESSGVAHPPSVVQQSGSTYLRWRAFS